MNQIPDIDRKTRSQARLIIVIVVAMFVAPIVLAWWFVHRGMPVEAARPLTNHGTLITPPIDTTSVPVLKPLASIGLRPSEWAVIFYGPGACTEVCQSAAEKLRVIRSVLGHSGSRVHVVALVDGPAVPGPVAAGTVLLDRNTRSFLSAALQQKGTTKFDTGLVFLDWRGQIMMYFPVHAEPAYIKDDLQRLLRASSIE